MYKKKELLPRTETTEVVWPGYERESLRLFYKKVDAKGLEFYS